MTAHAERCARAGRLLDSAFRVAEEAVAEQPSFEIRPLDLADPQIAVRILGTQTLWEAAAAESEPTPP